MEIINRLISDLIPAEYNPRTLSDKQFKDLKKSLQKFGFVDPVIINMHKDRKNIIVGGHQRVKVWESIGNDTVPCVEVILTEKQERELNVRLNKNSGSWDFDKLADFFDEMDLIDWGFEEWELDNIEVEPMDLTADEKNKPATMKITFKSIEELKRAEIEIKELLEGNYLTIISVSAGEL